MTEAEIRDAYLALFTHAWDSPTLVEELERLREKAEAAKLETWTTLIEARRLRALKSRDEALAVVERLLEREPDNPQALFLKGRSSTIFPLESRRSPQIWSA